MPRLRPTVDAGCQFALPVQWQEPLAEKRKLGRYDGRGSGLSDRDVADYSLEAHVLDLQAVIDRPGGERFALLGPLNSGPVAIAYAARYPERLSHLLLWCSVARYSDLYRSPETQALRASTLAWPWPSHNWDYRPLTTGQSTARRWLDSLGVRRSCALALIPAPRPLRPSSPA